MAKRIKKARSLRFGGWEKYENRPEKELAFS